MSTISLHLANTYSGEYDVRLPLPKPLHCDATTGRITRPADGRTFTQVIGFVEDPDDEPEDLLTWHEVVNGGPDDHGVEPENLLGTFPVVCEANGEFATLTLPVRGVSIDGVRLCGLEVE